MSDNPKVTLEILENKIVVKEKGMVLGL